MVILEIPESLALELDRLAEAEHKQRAAYVAELLWQDVNRQKQRSALNLSGGAWNSNHHPELAAGGPAYVETIRSERDERFEDAIRSNQTP